MAYSIREEDSPDPSSACLGVPAGVLGMGESPDPALRCEGVSRRRRIACDG